MGLRALHQWLPSFAPRDAIGSHALRIRDELVALGLESDIYVEEARGEVTGHSLHHRLHRWDDSGGSAILYHLSTGSAMAERLLHRPEPVLVDYHNITPAAFFEPWDPFATRTVEAGRRDLVRLAGRVTASMADSRFNESELVGAGYGRTGVVPILLDTSGFEREVDERVVEAAGGGPWWLFVGRIAPNKCQHDVISAFAAHRRVYAPGARLVLVGGVSSHTYLAALRSQVEALGLGDAVVFAGSVSDAELGAWYRVAEVFVCLSEHEGFCVPVLEAMFHGVPVVALGAAAVPETVGGAGVVLGDAGPLRVAAAVDRVLGDESLRARLVAAGHARVRDFALERTRARLMEFLTPILEEVAA